MDSWIRESVRVVWICLQSGFESIYCMYRISKLNKRKITIFGGKHAESDSVYAKNTYDLAAECVKRGMSVLTGGGPGTMEAANCGARSQAQKDANISSITLGIGVRGVDSSFVNQCAHVVVMSQMFMRQWFLMYYSQGFIIMPGGIGTAEELFELLDLIKLKKINSVPVVLFGIAYWKPMVDWFENSGVAQGFIKPECRNFFIVTDDVQQALDAISADKI